MPYFLISLLLSSLLVANELKLIDGFASAHTEVFGSSDINPLSTHITANVTYDATSKSLNGNITVHLDKFFSDHQGRDEHMYESMQRDLYPTINYHILSLKKSSHETYMLSGEMTLHGVTKRVNFTVNLTDTNRTLSIRGRGEIIMSDFKIKPPGLLFISVRDRVELFIKARFEKIKLE